MTEYSGELGLDTTFAGQVAITGDLVVPRGVILTLAPGTELGFAPSPRWSCSIFRSAPEGYPIEASLRSRCDMVVLGRLVARGSPAKPIRFGRRGQPWGGITALGAGRLEIEHAALEGAEEHLIQCFDDARAFLADVQFSYAKRGLLAWGLSRIACDGSRLEDLETGFLLREGARAEITGASFARMSEGLWTQQWSLARAADCRFLDCSNFGAGAYDHSRLKASGCSYAACVRSFVEETH